MTSCPTTNENRPRKHPPRRRAAATVELAVCLPLLITLVFAAIEGSNMIFTKQGVTAAAYEGARTAIRPGVSSADVQARVDEVIAARRIKKTKVKLFPADVSTVARGSRITVRVRANCNANTVGPSWYFKGRKLTAEVTMVKE